MTLSNWLKTYIYGPLMMTLMARISHPKAAPYIGIFAFFVTFFLVGLWHGQTSEFLFFGFLQGGGVAANKLYQVLMGQWIGRAGFRAVCANPIYAACARGLTYTWFAFTLFWFWSDWAQIGHFLTEIGGAATAIVWMSIFAIATAALAAVEQIRALIMRLTWRVDSGLREPIFHSRYLRTAASTFYVIVTIVITGLLGSPAPDIIYKTF
jgi:D-alanyl-lipoteichoic acid acyltransferase DltB (MBOAT superfamily)